MKAVFSIFHRGLQKTATSLARKFGSIFSGAKVWDAGVYEQLEEAMLGADFGVAVSLRLVEDIRDQYQHGLIKSSSDINQIARAEVDKILRKNYKVFDTANQGTRVVLLVGVNGCGKTTTVGKLAHLLKQDGKKVVLAACDTFRAAAVEQLNLWGERVGCHVVSAKHGADPAAVAYDAMASALAKNFDYLIVDTAGRQHNKKGLMDELLKVRKTLGKLCPGAPHETWLVVDGSVGSNALAQAREFSRVTEVNGLVFTKLDGSSKGGMVAAISDEFDIPVYFVGLGEGQEDLQPFNPDMFSEALFDIR